MIDEEPNWFPRWEEDLPAPEELMPISQTLITPDLAHAFHIPTPTSTSAAGINPSHPHAAARQTQPDFDSSDIGGGCPGDEHARTLKRPRLVWTPQLHKRFVDAVAHLGIKNAVPKTIMQMMSVDGLTRENVASHLQKYRLYLKRMQGISSGGGGVDPATDQLFASGPVLHRFLNRGPPGGGGGAGPEQFLPFVPVAALQDHQHMVAAIQQQQQLYHQRHIGSIGSPPGGGFDHGLVHRMIGSAGDGDLPISLAGSYMDDMKLGRGAGGGREVLTLFPTAED